MYIGQCYRDKTPEQLKNLHEKPIDVFPSAIAQNETQKIFELLLNC